MERLDHFMARANAEYYATRDPFADFTTSPEITQVFGEILGLWSAVTWDLIGRPDPVLLVEAGPGRGTLMADALRAITSAAPEFAAALRLHLIETSPRLRKLQAARLQGAIWHEGMDTLPHVPLLLLANEFLDALPIRQLVQRGESWTERFVDAGQFVEQPAALGRTGNCDDERLDPRLRGDDDPSNPAQPVTPAQLVTLALPVTLAKARAQGDDTATPALIEFSEPAHIFVRSLAARLTSHPGAALFLDYGPASSAPGDSLQAVRDGRPADPLADPGTADLTAHVDFPALATTCREAGATTYGPLPQGVFLTRLGLFQRTDRLAQTQPPAQALAQIEAARRLVEPDRMGRLFKALAVCHPGCPTPPGFEADTR
jgi:NADH dehydrogenase [ubiquinone] 1 alpha subcomplex assembly factor 7